MLEIFTMTSKFGVNSKSVANNFTAKLIMKLTLSSCIEKLKMRKYSGARSAISGLAT